MSLAPGARLGPYEILSPLGAGGMGEVYKAKDTRLGRDVAIKVLPEGLSQNPEFKLRFEREARAISQLTHPHICTLYDVGSADGVEYLVMELLEGQTLAERLEKGPLPPEQVLRSGVEIADALDKAHRAGIVHRDLKPGNIMMTKSGVKLLDFGLAKAAASGGRPSDLSSLPTEAERPLTERGTILGTFQYMSPEQLEGKEADSRADIFALGCVLYEMATGRKAFSGASRASLITAIMSAEPSPISAIAPMTPPALDRVVKTCLAKDPEDRWQSARDVKSELQWIAEAGSQAGAPAVVVSKRKNRERLAWICAGVAALAAALLAVGYVRRAPNGSRPIVATLQPPEKMFITEFSLSPDGTKLAFCALKPGGQPSLWVRSLSEPAAHPVSGAEEASFPFWSPDSRFVAFVGGDSLKRVDAAGGPILTICDAQRGGGGTWNRDGTIVFAPGATSPLFRVAASGGKPAPVTKLDASLHVTAHRYPSFLPDGRHFLYTAANLTASVNDPGSSIRVGSLDGKLDRTLVPLASSASYADGRLFYGRDTAILAQKIDLSRWEMKGDPVTIGEHVPERNWFGLIGFSVSEHTLVYLPSLEFPSQLTWFDRGGRSLGSIGDTRSYGSARLSPDGRRVAADAFDPARSKGEIWILDAASGAGTKFVSSNWADFAPVWSPGGDRLAFASTRKTKGAKPDIWMKRLDGSAEEPFLESPDNRIPEDWSADGRFLSFTATPVTGKRNTQLWIAETGGARRLIPFSVDAPSQVDSRISPDGRWIAYDSDESGKSEVYVRPCPEGAGKWQISAAGGGNPVWRRDGKELYYLSLDFKIMAVPISTSPTFRAGAPSPLFTIHPGAGQPFDVSADGKRFLVLAGPADPGSPPFSLVVNWQGLLKNE